MPSPFLFRRRALAAVLAVAIAVPSVATAGRVEATPPTADPATAAAYGARWAAARVNATGFVPGPTNAPNVSATIDTALALAEARVEQPTFALVMGWLQANVGLAIDPDATGDSPGNLGRMLLLANAGGIDPATFGGQDLVARLGATFGGFAPGLYGASDPTYDGVFRQSLAVLGLHAVGAVVPVAATTWLSDQQCDATVPPAAGGWQPYRTAACVAPDTMTFAGPDTNSTAMAIEALTASGGAPGQAAGLDFLAAAQDGTGGFPFIPGGDVDPNSTALVILAIIGGGEDPDVGRWANAGTTPYTSLLGWQLGCAAPAADRGAFSSPFSSGAADDFATRQAVWGATGRPLSAMSTVIFQTTAAPCTPATTTPAPTTTPPATVTSGDLVVPVIALPATAVATSPAFTG